MFLYQLHVVPKSWTLNMKNEGWRSTSNATLRVVRSKCASDEEWMSRKSSVVCKPLALLDLGIQDPQTRLA